MRSLIAETHAVENQPPPFWGRNLFLGDPLLRLFLDEALDGPIEAALVQQGAFWGSTDASEFARLANCNPPQLRTHDAYGRRLDVVDYHPAYHALMRRGVEWGLGGSIWSETVGEAGRRHALRAARLFLAAQNECGHLTALSSTSAAVAALNRGPVALEVWTERIRTGAYDHRFLPADRKRGVTVGFAFAEKQAGTDVKAIQTRAERGGDGTFRLIGHKWFVSAPMSDAFLTLAQTHEGLTLFFVPRFLPDGSVNPLRFQRLKSKLGNRANASAEIELPGVAGWPLGEPGRALRLLPEIAALTRLDSALAAAGLMRSAVAQAVHHARHREASGAPLIDKPLMSRVLADLALEVAGATALVQRLARSFDAAGGDDLSGAFARAMIPAVKYWVTKTAPAVVAEAIECLGANGYSEDFDLARLYREAPGLATWDGTGNAACLDLVRLVAADPEALDPAIELIAEDLGAPGGAAADVLHAAVRACQEDEGAARVLAEHLALTGAAAALRRAVPRAIADAFIDSRLGGSWRSTYGMLDARFDAAGIVAFLYPEG